MNNHRQPKPTSSPRSPRRSFRRGGIWGVLNLVLVLVLGSLLPAAVGAAEQPKQAASALMPPNSSLLAPAATPPPLGEFTDYLLVGMKPSSAGEAVTIGSSNEIGADRAVLSSNNNYGQYPGEITSEAG
jgi:hypothetical protein